MTSLTGLVIREQRHLLTQARRLTILEKEVRDYITQTPFEIYEKTSGRIPLTVLRTTL